VAAFYVASAVVTLIQFVRVRERRLVPLMLLFAFQGAGYSLGGWTGWGRLWHLAAGLCGLFLMLWLSRGAAVR
jgi:hypothetical protein